MPLSELAQRLECSERTARRYWAEPREQYELRSLQRSAPWLVEGISRSTWYRRRKEAALSPAEATAEDPDFGPAVEQELTSPSSSQQGGGDGRQ